MCPEDQVKNLTQEELSTCQINHIVRSFNFILSACFGLTKKVKQAKSNSAPKAVSYWSSQPTCPSLHPHLCCVGMGEISSNTSNVIK